jgi:hypothetical protein
MAFCRVTFTFTWCDVNERNWIALFWFEVADIAGLGERSRKQVLAV